MQKTTIKLSIISVALLSQLNAQTTINLDEITVTSATKSKQSIKDITANIVVITSEELEEKHYSSVDEALNTLAGISITRNGGLGKSTSIRVRGFDSKRVLVMIDGVRYNDLTGLNGSPFEHLMINDIEQIEVIKGAQSGVWGGDASAGVINIITKDAKAGLHGFLNGEYGSFDTLKYGAGASYKTDNYYLKASVQKVDTNGFSAQAPRGEDINNYEKDGYKNITSTFKLGYNINETNKIDISHTIIDANNNFDAYNDSDAKNTSKTNDAFTKINFNHIDSFNEVDVYASRSKFDRDYPQGWTKEFDGEVYEYGIKSNISYGKKDFITLGMDYKTFEHKNDLNEKYTNKGFFVTNSNLFKCPLAGDVIVTQSLRYDNFSEFDNKTTAKLGIKRVISDDLSFSINYGSAYNTPTLYNLFDATYGEKNLKPEDTTSYDISLNYKNLTVTYFDSKIKDMIDFDMVNWKYKNNDGTTKLKGIEVEYVSNVSDDILLTSNYTYLSAKNSNGEDLARRVKNSFKLSVDYYGFENLHLGVNGEYVGKRYDSDNQQGEQTGRYTVVNLLANYDINKHLLIYAKVDNLFDKYYQTVDGYTTAPLSGCVGFKASF